jgi:hypothetical protein
MECQLFFILDGGLAGQPGSLKKLKVSCPGADEQQPNRKKGAHDNHSDAMAICPFAGHGTNTI